MGMEKVVCQTSGQWSGEQPTCKHSSGGGHSPYYCGSPPKIDNASHNGSDEQTFFDLDAELSYQCFPGFRRDRNKGFDNAKCFFMNGTAVWFGPDLDCIPIDCGQPEDIIHGMKHGSCMSYRCQINYDCQPGFQLVGSSTRICQADGTWTQNELPTCIPVQCGIPPNPVNGKSIFTAVAYKSVVSYKCKYGFMIVGNGTRTCDADKKWSGTGPKCREINCGQPNGGLFPNGWFEGSRTSLNAVMTFRCIEGMKFEGEKQQATCKADGKWSIPVPKCLAPCIIPQVDHGIANGHIGEKVTHGEKLEINCTENYEVRGDGDPIVCSNGTWSKVPKCSPARCKTMPAPPRNGMIVVPQTSHGSMGLYQCKDGYNLKGDNRTTCIYGNWTGTTPSCEETYCPFPGYLQFGKILLVGNMGLYDYRPYVKKISNDRQIMFDCDKGYKLELGSPQGATCVDGQWSPQEIPACLPEYHPSIRWLEKRSVKMKDVENFLTPIIGRTTGRMKRSLGDGNEKCPELDKHLLQLTLIKTSEGKDVVSYNDVGATIEVKCKEGYGLLAERYSINNEC